MKAKSRKAATASSSELKDEPTPYAAASARDAAMIRTQIYLTPAEYHFLQAEAQQRKEPMAAVLRAIIDEKMELPDEAWTNNPMLQPTPKDPGFSLPEDAAINHDHYLYGTPKRYVKVKGKWILAKEGKR